MLSSIACLLIVSAAPETALVLDVERDGVSESVATTIAALLSDQLADDGFEVLSADDLERALNVEATKQELGCDDEECLSELADAYDTDLVVFTRAARLGRQLVVNVTFFDSERASARARETLVLDDEAELPVAITRVVKGKIAGASSPWIVGSAFIGAGVLALGAGVGTLVLLDNHVDDDALSPAERQGARTIGWVVAGATVLTCVAGVAGGVVWGMGE